MSVFFGTNANNKPQETAETCEKMPLNSKTVKVYDYKNDRVFDMDFEEYLVGVLIGEMPASYEIEALKAQTVAARSYILDKMKTFEKYGAPSEHKGAQICTNPSHCKAWMSISDAESNWGIDWTKKYLGKLKRAVAETKGEYMTCNGDIVKAFFFSISHGSTENSRDVWGGENYSYLRPVASIGDTECPDFESTVEISADAFLAKLKEKRPDVKEDKISNMLGPVTFTEGGSVANITIGGENFRGTEIRSIFNLRSADFKINTDDKTVIFDVKGHGHGVGMSQYGANCLAKDGKNYHEILEYYYNGVNFERLKY
jgi:stage II sporulation protein D